MTMIPPFNGFPRGLIAAFLLALLATGPAFGQIPSQAARAQALAAHRQANADAKTQAASGDISAATQTLDRLSSAPVGSAARLFETAQRLTQLANNLSRAANPAAARAAAARALQALTEADRQTNDPDLKAAIRGQMGFLHERFLGDVESAKTAYRAAAQLAPNNKTARVRAERIEQTDANTRRVRAGR